MKHLREARRRLIESLRLLAAEPDVQLLALPDGVHKPDEIALIFDDCYAMLDQVLAGGVVPEAAVSQLHAVNGRLDSMSGSGQPYWTEQAITTRQTWVELRADARRTLELLGEEAIRPRIDWLRFTTD